MAGSGGAGGRELDRLVVELQATVADRLLPTLVARRDGRGGFALHRLGARVRQRRVKSLVSQARAVWTLSLATRRGLGAYLDAADHGAAFLRERLRDPRHGGYVWLASRSGRPVSSEKLLYGQVFAILALVERHRAGGCRGCLEDALDCFALVDRHLHDREHGGWLEHAGADWSPTAEIGAPARLRVPGQKSADTHLHVVEALTELYEVSGESVVRDRLDEALDVCATRFFAGGGDPPVGACARDWTPVPTTGSARPSLGLDVQAAWLMLRAEQVLGRPQDRAACDRLVDRALDLGFDRANGGLTSWHRPSAETNRVFWMQAELVSALAYTLAAGPRDPEREAALALQLRWILSRQIDRDTGVWREIVARDAPLRPAGPLHHWKAGYHETRAAVLAGGLVTQA